MPRGSTPASLEELRTIYLLRSTPVGKGRSLGSGSGFSLDLDLSTLLLVIMGACRDTDLTIFFFCMDPWENLSEYKKLTTSPILKNQAGKSDSIFLQFKKATLSDGFI